MDFKHKLASIINRMKSNLDFFEASGFNISNSGIISGEQFGRLYWVPVTQVIIYMNTFNENRNKTVIRSDGKVCRLFCNVF